MLAGVARSIRSSRLPEGETDLTLGYARAFQEIGETLMIPTIGITEIKIVAKVSRMAPV
jgi:hypothetical protein